MEEDKEIDEKIYTFKLDKMNAQEKKNFMVLIEKFAENMSGAKMFELVKVGWNKLVGEIIKLDRD